MNINAKIISVFLILLGLFLYYKDNAELDPSLNYPGIIELTDVNFNEEVLNSELPSLVFFYGKDCEFSRKKMPSIKEIAKKINTKEKLKIYKAEVATVYLLDSKGIPNPAISQRYKIGGLPTLIIFKNGKELMRDINGENPNLYHVDIMPTLENLSEVKLN